MCNRDEQEIAYAEYCKMMQREALRVAAHQGPADLPPLKMGSIGDVHAIITLQGGEAVLTPMSWGWPPGRPGAGPVFNFRSEGRHFKDSRRCLIPVSAFYEYRGDKAPKSMFRFTPPSDPFAAIAGLWKPGEGNAPPTYTMLTTAPGPDMAPYHKRQVAMLRPGTLADWLDLPRPESELIGPLPAGSLAVEQVR